MKIITFVMLVFLSTHALADFIKLNAYKLNGKILTQGVALQSVQAQLLCRMYNSKTNTQKISRRYPHTYMENNGDGEYFVRIKKQSLFDGWWSFKITSCAYKLIVIGTDSTERTLLGDIVLMGREREDMSEQELSRMRDKKGFNEVLKNRLSNLRLQKGVDRKGKTRIVEAL